MNCLEFLPGRKIHDAIGFALHDAIGVAQEGLHFIIIKNMSSTVVKINLSRAYN